MLDQSTICAITTGTANGAVAMIRVAGENAIAITDQIFKSPKSGKKLVDQKANTLHFGRIINGDEILDEVVVSLFKAPHSYTGEDVVEISCHGSAYIQQELLQLLISNGARLAKPGEFTQRAFLNGKMDLSQAEAVADVIASGSKAAHKVAISQLRGGFSNELSQLREQLLHFTAMVELELDFAEEDVEFADRTELKKLLNQIDVVISRLVNSFQLGNAIKNGIPVTIAGETNVGKSTLLNALLNEERAIVSDIEGTTRDVIEDTLNIDGITFRFIDTAGIRTTEDQIENLGIERTFQKIDQAQIVLLLLDLTKKLDKNIERLEEIRERIDDQQLIIVGNKADESGSPAIRQLMAKVSLDDHENMAFISAKKGENIDYLKELLIETVNLSQLDNDEVIVTNARHFEALSKANEALQRVVNGIDMQISGDFLAQDIRECLHFLGEITGDISTDEVLGHIFKNFCIGK
ncbi:tRNA uridine-5-carboxymethylaminomethyl(34) synthesis GTPase MnmE [Prolixibacteraceae bacterium JC049]|nr:tRNA uridine-5-carboxymethylaminomethyl(34) synthesis GTPase MnmE [Prolixibacteraceae bacterium JC049]